MIYKLGQLLREINEKTTVNNQYPVLTSSKSGIFLQEDYFTKTVASRDNTGYKIIRKGQFTYRSMSDTGLFFINCLTAVEIGIVSPAYPVFEIKDEKVLNREFLIHFFRSASFNKKITAMSKGSTRLSLKYKDLKEVDIDLPTLSEQIKIASNLNELYKFIDNANAQRADFDELLGSKFLEMFKDESETIKLGDCCEIHARIGWQALKKDEHLTEGDYLLVTGTDFKDNEVDYSTCVYVSKERYEMDPHIILRNDDVLITKDGTIGKVAIVHSLPKPATLNSGVFVVRPDSRFNKEYIAYVFKGPLFEKFVENVKTGATINHLNQKSLVSFNIPLPSAEKQKRFSDLVKLVNEAVSIANKRILSSQELLSIMMEEYFE